MQSEASRFGRPSEIDEFSPFGTYSVSSTSSPDSAWMALSRLAQISTCALFDIFTSTNVSIGFASAILGDLVFEYMIRGPEERSNGRGRLKSKLGDEADTSDQENATDDATQVQRVRLHSEPTEAINQQRRDEHGGNRKADKRPGTNFMTSVRPAYSCTAPTNPPTTAHQGNSAKSFSLGSGCE
jgi:hypothetical protein